LSFRGGFSPESLPVFAEALSGVEGDLLSAGFWRWPAAARR